jgi:hypothetical protein
MNRPKKINCTPTYRSYYGDGYILRGRGSSQYDHTMDWFYIAYPDVAYFIYDNLKSLDEVILGKEAFYVKDGMLTLHFYRDMIDLYKSKGNILECAVDN